MCDRESGWYFQSLAATLARRLATKKRVSVTHKFNLRGGSISVNHTSTGNANITPIDTSAQSTTLALGNQPRISCSHSLSFNIIIFISHPRVAAAMHQQGQPFTTAPHERSPSSLINTPSVTPYFAYSAAIITSKALFFPAIWNPTVAVFDVEAARF
jgi:hypothetical protein